MVLFEWRDPIHLVATLSPGPETHQYRPVDPRGCEHGKQHHGRSEGQQIISKTLQVFHLFLICLVAISSSRYSKPINVLMK